MRVRLCPPALNLDLCYFVINHHHSTDEFCSREEWTFGISSRLNENCAVGFRHQRDIEEDRALLSSSSLAYQDECFLIETVAQRSNYDDREIEEDDSVFVRVVFKYLGGVSGGCTGHGDHSRAASFR